MPDDGSSPEQTPTADEDRALLVARARQFLLSPQVQHEDLTAKRRFLLEKGLNDAEVEALLRDVVRTHPPFRGVASA